MKDVLVCNRKVLAHAVLPAGGHFYYKINFVTIWVHCDIIIQRKKALRPVRCCCQWMKI